MQSSKIVSTPLEVSIETSDGTVILIKEEQPEKHPQPKNSTDDGTMKLTKEEQPEKQYSLNPNTDDGIVMFAKEEQPEYFQPIVYQYVQIKTVEKWLRGFDGEWKRRRFNVFNFRKPQKT